MERQELLYILLGGALGVIFTSILFLRAPMASERAYELGIRKKAINVEPANSFLNQSREKNLSTQELPSY